MPLSRWFDQTQALPGASRIHLRRVTAEQWQEAAQAVAAQGGRLLSMWSLGPVGAVEGVAAAFMTDRGVLILELQIDTAAAAAAQANGTTATGAVADYPGLEQLFPAAGRLQRTIADLAGLRSGDADTRPWLRHAAWPTHFCPLRDAVAPPSAAPAANASAPGAVVMSSAEPDAGAAAQAYEFVRVDGEGVHEIAVGPVHAGVIEPGHFRFSVVGETVLRLEERLGYAHKGIERRFSELPLREGHRLAARISGDSAVAFSWAYCQALEGAAELPVPDRALWLRALALELERIANHLGDLGALGNDAGFAFALTQFSRLKERLLRAIEQALGQRYLMDYIVPGGTRDDLAADAAAGLGRLIALLGEESAGLQTILEEHAGVRDRFLGAGTVAPALARRLGLTGLAGRASGQAHDLRRDLPWTPYDALAFEVPVRETGDVTARVAVRFAELAESCSLVRQILARLPPGPHRAAYREPAAGRDGVGLIEGWRGPVMIALQAGAGGTIARCHAHDCSWQNWPVIEHAVIGNIVADFPLINKSFNLAYSGHDL